jgi:hypothetical protein
MIPRISPDYITLSASDILFSVTNIPVYKSPNHAFQCYLVSGRCGSWIWMTCTFSVVGGWSLFIAPLALVALALVLQNGYPVDVHDKLHLILYL